MSTWAGEGGVGKPMLPSPGGVIPNLGPGAEANFALQALFAEFLTNAVLAVGPVVRRDLCCGVRYRMRRQEEEAPTDAVLVRHLEVLLAVCFLFPSVSAHANEMSSSMGLDPVGRTR